MRGLRGGTLIVAALVVAVTAGAAVACDAPGGTAGLRQEVIGWINDSRRAKGLPALKASAALQASATAHACDMAGRGYFSHEGPGGPSLARRLRKAGYRYRAATENIAKTRSVSVENVTGIWRDSPLHWANVLNPRVREVGVGVAQAGGRIFWVTDAGVR